MIVALSNCSPDESDDLAAGLVDGNLAACVNILPGVTSVYRWEGEVCADQEHTLVIKTTEKRYPAMKEWLEEHHSYDVPEIVALEAEDVLEAYLDWTVRQTTPDEPSAERDEE